MTRGRQLSGRAMLKLKTFLNRRADANFKDVLKSASAAFLLKNIGTVLSFGFNIVLGRLLGAHGSGLYYLALSFTSVAVMISRFGLDNTLVRFSAAHASKEEWSAVKGLYYRAMAVSSFVAVLVSVVTWFLAPVLAVRAFSQPELTPLIQLMSLSIFPTSLLTLYAQLLTGVKKTSQAVAVQLVLPQAATMLVTLLAAPVWGLTGAVWAYTAGALVTAVISFIWWRQATFNHMKDVLPAFEMRDMLRSSLPLFWQSLFLLVPKWASTWMLGIWASSADVGIFSVATRTAFMISFILVAVNSASSPRFAEMYSKGDLKGVGRLARDTALIMALFSAPILLFLLIFPGWVMSWYGPEFRSGGLALAILALGQYINTSSGSVQRVLMMCGYENLMRNVAAFCAVLVLLLNVLLIPPYGVLGAAIASAVTLSVQNILVAILVKQKMGIWTLPFVYLVQRLVQYGK
jgi:O-antigen/teichoic acid export membrane protein